MKKLNREKISIIGGAGHVGFPLGLAFANKGYNVDLIDKNLFNLSLINKGKAPFLELGAEKILNKCLKKKVISTKNHLKDLIFSKYLIICIGTPITKKLDPDLKSFINFFKKLKKYIHKHHYIIIRSSIYPGTLNKIEKVLKKINNNILYCPERIVQGKALIELNKLPQIISSNNLKILENVGNLFNKICLKVIKTNVIEAELIKLFSNANRYINFSIANQFYLMCNQMNINFSRVRNIMQDGYERNLNLPLSGLTAGPCLLKDTMQLSSFFKKKFYLGHAAMNINESFPKFIFDKIRNIKNYKRKKIGILGLTFKANNDDIRDSLAIKLINLLEKNRLKVLKSDQFFNFNGNIDKKNLIKNSDIIVIGAPHKSYFKIKFPKNKIIIDVWGIFEKKI